MRAESPSAIAVHVAVSLCILGLGAPGVAQAQAARVSETSTTASTARPLADAHDDEARAREWGLRAEDWSRYRTLMQGPLGIYSPNLDPLTALGIEARSDEERRRYAELQVQAEARRVQRTL
ncbi:integrating conjugative element protein, partial [Xanthomonas sp. LMG 12462]